MKKLTLLFIVFISFSICSYGQQNIFLLGIKAGGNLSSAIEETDYVRSGTSNQS